MNYETKSKKLIYRRVNKILTEKGITKASVINPSKNKNCLDKSTFRQMYRPEGVDSRLSTIIHFCDAIGITIQDFFDDPIFSDT